MPMHYRNHQLPAATPAMRSGSGYPQRRRRRNTILGGAAIGSGLAGAAWLKKRSLTSAAGSVPSSRVRPGFLGPKILSRADYLKERADKVRYKASRAGRRERGARAQQIWQNRQIVQNKTPKGRKKLKRSTFRGTRVSRFIGRHTTGIQRASRILALLR